MALLHKIQTYDQYTASTYLVDVKHNSRLSGVSPNYPLSPSLAKSHPQCQLQIFFSPSEPHYSTPQLSSDLWHSRLQLHPMPSLNLLPQHLIHQPLLLQHTQSSKPLTCNLDPIHTPTTTGYIFDLYDQTRVSHESGRFVEYERTIFARK